MTDEANKTLRELQAELPWGANDYSATYHADAAPHRDYRHAVLHIAKCAGKLTECPEEMDHDPDGKTAARWRHADEKRLADLVIVALRMASTHPSGPIDLASAVEARIAEKFATGTRVVAGKDRADPHVADEKPAKRTCNKHVDCDAADARAGGREAHCHDDDCPDCFGQ